MKLYYAPGASSLAPHIVLREADRTFDLERVDLETHRTARGVDYATINPRGHIPALELDGPGSTILTENVAILSYLADLVPDAHLAPPNGTFARYHLLDWLGFVASELDHHFRPLFSPTTPARTQEIQRAELGERFLYLQDVLTDRPCLMGESFTVADAYLFVMLTWCDRFHLDLQLWPNLDDYYLRIRNRPAVQAAMAAEGLIEHRWRAA